MLQRSLILGRPLQRTASLSVSGHSALRRASSKTSWRKVDEFNWFVAIQTRWKVRGPLQWVVSRTCTTTYILPSFQDNDRYGHVNNTEFVSYFDTAINIYLSRHCGQPSAARGFMVKS